MSLKEQLQKLAVPQNRHHLESQKSSLLFDPNEVASLDSEVVLELAISGLNALVALNKSFAKYEPLLFNKSFDRMIQGKKVNEDLDNVIKQYLIELSPYFLTKPALKTLEWLVYKYQIHQFNIDALLMTILPYHYSNMFVKVLTILDIQNPTNKWHWLYNCAKSGIPLPKSVLINHCKKDSLFLHSIFNYVDDYVEQFGRKSSRLNLFLEHVTHIGICLLNNVSEVTEEIVSVLIQFCIRGLKSKCLIWELSCYSILSSLTANVTLNFNNVLLLCRLIAKKHSNKLFKEAMCCLSVIVANQNGEYPDDLFKFLKLDDTNLLEIQTLNEMFDMKKFMNLLSKTNDKISVKKQKKSIKAKKISVENLEKVSPSGDFVSLPKSHDSLKCSETLDNNAQAIEQITELETKFLANQEDHSVIDALVNLAMSGDSVLFKHVKACFRKFALKHIHISHVLNENNDLPKRKKLKSEKSPLNPKKIQTLLEMMLDGKELDGSKEMCLVLTSLLSRLSGECSENMEYCIQLVLTIFS